MAACGFRVGRYTMSAFHHRARNLRVVVHGDDFIAVGGRLAVGWFRGRLEGRFEIKHKTIGCQDGEVVESRVLNRIIRRTSQGWEIEADQRHAELVVKVLNLTEAKTVAAPGEKAKPWQLDEDAVELGPRQATGYRGIAARINYMALESISNLRRRRRAKGCPGPRRATGRRSSELRDTSQGCLG